MRTKWALTLLLALGISAVPAMAGHKHRHGCGHVYSQARRGWISVGVASRNFGFSYQSGPRYYGDRYYGDRYYDGRHRGYSRGWGGGYWDPYRYDSRYDKHRGYWRDHHGHRHGYKDRCR